MDGILYNVYYDERAKKVRIISDELPMDGAGKRLEGENMIGQTEGTSNLDDLENIIKRINPNIEVEVITGEE